MSAEIFNNILRQYGKSVSRLSRCVTTYDQKSRELAELFLEDAPEINTGANAHDLALAIQNAIEDWFADKQRHPDKGEK